MTSLHTHTADSYCPPPQLPETRDYHSDDATNKEIFHDLKRIIGQNQPTGRWTKCGKDGPRIVVFEDAMQTVIAPRFRCERVRAVKLLATSSGQRRPTAAAAGRVSRPRTDAIRRRIRQMVTLLLRRRLGSFSPLAMQAPHKTERMTTAAARFLSSRFTTTAGMGRRRR